MHGGLEIRWMVAEVERDLKYRDVDKLARSRGYESPPEDERPSWFRSIVARTRRAVRLPRLAARPAQAGPAPSEVSGGG